MEIESESENSSDERENGPSTKKKSSLSNKLRGDAAPQQQASLNN